MYDIETVYKTELTIQHNRISDARISPKHIFDNIRDMRLPETLTRAPARKSGPKLPELNTQEEIQTKSFPKMIVEDIKEPEMSIAVEEVMPI